MIQFAKEADQLVCTLPARLDTTACTTWQDGLLKRIEEEKAPVVFDMAKVDYISSAFIRICLQVFKQVGEDRFRLINLSPDVKKVFKIAGLDEHLAMS
ncbi:MAG: STAS domain-containing protein [Verrucomicrobia bacterium]|nr:STAS domain-containing protein [Verrucomicrobiota bacterium]